MATLHYKKRLKSRHAWAWVIPYIAAGGWLIAALLAGIMRLKGVW